jgi:hypothetical protein
MTTLLSPEQLKRYQEIRGKGRPRPPIPFQIGVGAGYRRPRRSLRGGGSPRRPDKPVLGGVPSWVTRGY